MKISLYTFVRNGLRLDFHVVEMLRHHLKLADEIIVNEGYSTDGTYEAISAIDPKIKVFRSDWGKPVSLDWYCRFKNETRRRCTGDWCVYLDCDEFVPEWQFEPLRRHLATTTDDLMAIDVVNFYGNYKVFHADPESVRWASRKVAFHRNRPDIEFWGDASNVRIRDRPFEWPERPYEFSCHHFGFVRRASRLREKWRAQARTYSTVASLPIPGFIFDLLPHQWDDAMFSPKLAVYEGPFIEAVRDNPGEFVRDGMQMFKKLAGSRQNGPG